MNCLLILTFAINFRQSYEVRVANTLNTYYQDQFNNQQFIILKFHSPSQISPKYLKLKIHVDYRNVLHPNNPIPSDEKDYYFFETQNVSGSSIWVAFGSHSDYNSHFEFYLYNDRSIKHFAYFKMTLLSSDHPENITLEDLYGIVDMELVLKIESEISMPTQKNVNPETFWNQLYTTSLYDQCIVFIHKYTIFNFLISWDPDISPPTYVTEVDIELHKIENDAPLEDYIVKYEARAWPIDCTRLRSIEANFFIPGDGYQVKFVLKNSFQSNSFVFAYNIFPDGLSEFGSQMDIQFYQFNVVNFNVLEVVINSPHNMYLLPLDSIKSVCNLNSFASSVIEFRYLGTVVERTSSLGRNVGTSKKVIVHKQQTESELDMCLNKILLFKIQI